MEDILDDLFIEDEIKQLRARIAHYNKQYYQYAISEISDQEFDKLLKRLEALEEKYPQYRSTDSPADLVGSDITNKNKVIPHKVRMYSLSNAYTIEEIEAFHDKITRETDKIPHFTTELKLDGFSVNLFYNDGSLQYATTRGDGFEGEDITENVKTINLLPHKINYNEQIEIRGEIFLPRNEFNRINKERENNDENLFANPRNAAAGTIKLKNSEIVKSRNLDYRVYSVGYFKNDVIKSQYKLLKFFEEQGFKTMISEKKVQELVGYIAGKEAIKSQCRSWEHLKDNLEYEVDGLVIKVDDFDLQQKIGFTSKFPKWAIAYKFKAEEAETQVLGVEFQVGRTGAVTPVAGLKPVLISGSTVSNATLHNEDEIKRLDLKIGDYVTVIKSGEIIPKIIGVNHKKRKKDVKDIDFPTNCPVCSSKLRRAEDGAITYCSNANCPAQVQKRIEHFASRNAVDIEGLGEAVVQQLIAHGQINKIQDIYKIDYEEFATYDKQGNKSAENLKQAIIRSKNQKFHKILFGLGIRFVGEKISKVLCSHFKNIEEIIKADIEQLTNIEEIGEKIAKSVHEFFKNENNLKMVRSLQEAGLKMINEDSETQNILQGAKFIITGTLENFKRDEIKELIENHGGKVISAVSKNLNYLVVGNNPGSKLQKAEKIDSIKIINENEFIDLIGLER